MTGREDEKPVMHENQKDKIFILKRMTIKLLLGIFVAFGIVIVLLVISNFAQAEDYGTVIQYKTPSNGVANVTPGIDYTYAVDIINTGVNNTGEDLNFTVELDAASIAAGWMVTPDGTTIIPNVQMDIDNKTTEIVTVRAPSDAKFEDTAIVSITVEVIGHEGEVGCQDSLQLRANVVQVYDVLVTTTQDTKTGDPGESIPFIIKITNQGNGDDTFVFSDIGLELGIWSHTDVSLGPGEFIIVYYNVTIDQDHDTSDILITLNISSVEDVSGMTYGTLDITVHVNPRYGVKLGVDGGKYKEVFGGQTVSYNLTVQNKGTVNDIFYIEAIGSTSFWVILSNFTVTLEPEEKITVIVWVTPPEETAIGVYDIITNVTSQNDASATGEYTFYADVQATYDFLLSSTTIHQKVHPGDTATFTGVKIKNEGNEPDIYIILITNLPPGWSYDPISDIYVDPGDTVSFDIRIHTAEASPPGLYDIYLTVRSVNDPTKERTLPLVVEVDQDYGIQLTATTTTKTGDMGETLSYFIQVKNTGNGEDYFELRLTGEHTEFAILYYDSTKNGQIIHVSPPAGGSLGVYLNITIPSNYWDIETQNQFTITVEAESLYDPSILSANASESFTTTVNPVYGVDIISGGYTSDEPGETVSFLFEVKNTGTTTDSYSIEVMSITTTTGGDTGLWYPGIAIIPPNISNLAKGATQSINMYVTIPFPSDLSLVPPGLYNISVKVTSQGDTNVKDTQAFKVNVKQFYWADVQDIVTNKNVNVGETVQYPVTIKNKGNDYDMLNVELEGDPDIPGSVSWGKLTHLGSGQIDSQVLTDIPLDAGQSTDIILTITVPQRTDPSYPNIDPDDITIIIKVKPSDENGIDDQVPVTTDINTIYEFDFTFLVKTFDVEPGNPAEFTINVENKGTATETFTYEIFQWDDDWSEFGYYFIPSSGNLHVGAGNIGQVTLVINTPSDLQEALCGDYNITIRIHSSAGDIDIFKNCTIHLEPVYDVEITTMGSTSKAVNVGDNVSFQFSVRNTGNSKETFPFTVSDLDTSSNTGGDQTSWAKLYLIDDLTTSITSVELNPDATVVLILNIKVPDDDLDFGKISPLQIEVEVTSAQDETISDSFIATTTINPIYDFEFKTPDAFMDGEPGDSVPFTMEVTNKGTDADSYTFSVTDVDTVVFPGATQIYISPIFGLKVGGSETTTVTFSITDDKNKARVGTYQIEVTATSDADKSVKKILVLNVKILASAEVEITPASQSDSGEPGDVVTYKVTITNKGNAEDTFELTLSGTYKNWAEFYDFTGTQKITERKLNATGVGKFFEEITVKVTIPLSSDEETTAGQSYPITIKAASTTTEGVSDTAQVTTTVDEYIDLVLEYSGSGEPRVDFDPNENQPKFRFKVTNNGNIDETGITVNVDDMPTLWNQPTIDFIDILEPGKSTTFSIEFNIPSDEDEGEYDIQISVTSTEPSFTSDPVFITINITKPDLSVSSSDVTGLDDLPYLKGNVGNAVTVKVRIHNVGHSNAEEVVVKLYEDKIVIGTNTISSIAADSYEDVDFKWVVVAEEVEMKIEVTPLEEIDDGNNAISPIYLDLRPDLSFGGEQINFSKTNPAPNDEITITAFIKNDGGNVEDVAVKFYYGTKVIGTKNIDIDYDETAKAEVSWKVPDEPEKILVVMVEIDKAGAKGDGDEVTKSIEVTSTEVGEIFDYLWIISVIIVGLVAFFAGYFARRRGKEVHFESETMEKGIGEKETPPGDIARPKMMPPPPPPPPPPPQPTIDQWISDKFDPEKREDEISKEMDNH